jgi:tetraacyldisaccharide 4'-kinase
LPDILGSYLRYARGESGRGSVWAALGISGALLKPLIVARNAFYDRGLFCTLDPPLPVLSIGNLCNGGTNKTPMVDMMARRLMEWGLSVGIVSRGYSGVVKSPMWVGQGGVSSDRSITGDEPLMLAERLPGTKVVVSPDRHDGVCYLRELGADVVLADDAFQHRRMGRDLDIVLIDATCPFGNGKLFPAGILREHVSSLRRADIVILTKAEQAGGNIDAIREKISPWTSPETIFTARVCVESWMRFSDEGLSEFVPERGNTPPQCKFIAFSAIGNPQSFYDSLISMGLDVVKNCAYRDHHRFTWRDIDMLERHASMLGASAFICTEKDLQNMPDNLSLLYPLYIPKISVSIDDDDNFWRAASKKLRPRFIVASNGHGEDSMGSILALRLKERFPSASVSAFSLVGSGTEYRDRGIEVISPDSDMPSAGIVKYSARALIGDFKHGLRKMIKKQIEVWRRESGRFRTPICVGDVYLMAHTLWGQGMTPLLVATAKSVRLSGHWMAERALMRSRARRVWTRDKETADDLRARGVDAVFKGNPIMDLARSADMTGDPWDDMPRPHVMLLPGSRPRAYKDAKMLLDAVKLISENVDCGFIMVLAPTLDMDIMLKETGCRMNLSGMIAAGFASVKINTGPISPAARGADILIGLGGTANQVAAGLGAPVLSIIEKGKLVQKKLLGDSEILAPPNAKSLADAALDILADPMKRSAMSRAGIELMGGPGALDSVAEYAADELGWDARCMLFDTLSRVWLAHNESAVLKTPDDHDREEVRPIWKMPKNLASRVMKAVKIIK